LYQSSPGPISNIYSVYQPSISDDDIKHELIRLKTIAEMNGVPLSRIIEINRVMEQGRATDSFTNQMGVYINVQTQQWHIINELIQSVEAVRTEIMNLTQMLDRRMPYA